MMGKNSALCVLMRTQKLIRFFSSKENNEATLEDVLLEVYDFRVESNKYDNVESKKKYDKYYKNFENKKKIFRRDRENAANNLYLNDDDYINFEYNRQTKKYKMISNVHFLLQLKISQKEAIAFTTGLKVGSHFLPHIKEPSESLYKKIKGYIPENILSVGERLSGASTVFVPVSSMEEEPGVFDKVLKAIEEKRAISVLIYTDFNGNISKRTISPWMLFLRDHSWYVFGAIDGMPNPKESRISRMRAVSVGDKDEYKEPPKGMCIEEMLKKDYDGRNPEKTYNIKLRIFPPFSRPVLSTEWFPGETKKKDLDHPNKDVVLYEVQLRGLEAMTRWIARAADCIQILEPEELKHKVRDKLKNFFKINDLK